LASRFYNSLYYRTRREKLASLQPSVRATES